MGNMEITQTRVEAIISPVLEKRQVKLCGVKVSGRLSSPLIQIFIDWEESPITIAECVKVSREIQDLFDIEERFAPDYRLEVSSPGIDSPLEEAWQFRRNIGRVIRVDHEGIQVEATILDVTSDGISKLEIEGEEVRKPFTELSGSFVVLFPKKKSLAKRKRNEA